MLAAVIVVGLVQGGQDAVRGLAWRVGALVVGIGLIRATSMNAHGSQGSDPAWGEVADLLHLAGVSAWVGGLVMLTVGVLPRGRLDELEVVVPRFSKVAQISVLLIVASGLILVWRLIWPIDGLLSTHYNRVLAIKLGLFVLVMVAAAASKRWVDRNVTGTDGGPPDLRRTRHPDLRRRRNRARGRRPGGGQRAGDLEPRRMNTQPSRGRPTSQAAGTRVFTRRGVLDEFSSDRPPGRHGVDERPEQEVVGHRGVASRCS